MVRRGTARKGVQPYGVRRFFVHLAAVLASLFAGALPAGAAPGDLRIFALGDSLTAGFGLPRRLGFTVQLQAYLRRQGIRAYVTNAGVSGDTAAQGLARLTWTLDGLEQKPDLAIVALGANDMLRGLPVGETRGALEDILAELQRRQIRLVLAGMVAAPNLGPDFARQFNAVFPALAQAHGATFYPFFLEGVAGRAELNQPDGLHPTFQGVKVIVEGIAPKVIEAARR